MFLSMIAKLKNPDALKGTALKTLLVMQHNYSEEYLQATSSKLKAMNEMEVIVWAAEVLGEKEKISLADLLGVDTEDLNTTAKVLQRVLASPV
jgi:hypothetical protein